MFRLTKCVNTRFDIKGVPLLYLSVFTRMNRDGYQFVREIERMDRFKIEDVPVIRKGVYFCPLPYVDVCERGTENFIRRFHSLDHLFHLFGDRRGG